MTDPLQKDFKLKGLLALNLAQTAAALDGLLGSSSQEKRQPLHGVAHLSGSSGSKSPNPHESRTQYEPWIVSTHHFRPAGLELRPCGAS